VSADGTNSIGSPRVVATIVFLIAVLVGLIYVQGYFQYRHSVTADVANVLIKAAACVLDLIGLGLVWRLWRVKRYYTRVGSELNRIGQFVPSRRLWTVQF
jgi:hypothetical protein